MVELAVVTEVDSKVGIPVKIIVESQKENAIMRYIKGNCFQSQKTLDSIFTNLL